MLNIVIVLILSLLFCSFSNSVVPFFLILTGLALAGFSLFGMQTVFFGYGFHF
jgi:hypothetical protein